MRVFISWSGERSRIVAEALRDWFPCVLQELKPWVSAKDIDKGSRWRTGLASELELARIGIICLTSDNLDSPWLLFEAGALSKQQQDTFVFTVLVGLKPTDIKDPLAQFEPTRLNKEDLRKLIHSINQQITNPLTEKNVDDTFDLWWPKLERQLADVPEQKAVTQPPRDNRDILEEILQLVRQISGKTADANLFQQRAQTAASPIDFSFDYEPASRQLYKLKVDEREEVINKLNILVRKEQEAISNLKSLLSSRALLEKDREESNENTDS